jgi:hypothetical protein
MKILFNLLLAFSLYSHHLSASDFDETTKRTIHCSCNYEKAETEEGQTLYMGAISHKESDFFAKIAFPAPCKSDATLDSVCVYGFKNKSSFQFELIYDLEPSTHDIEDLTHKATTILPKKYEITKISQVQSIPERNMPLLLFMDVEDENEKGRYAAIETNSGLLLIYVWGNVDQFDAFFNTLKIEL